MANYNNSAPVPPSPLLTLEPGQVMMPAQGAYLYKPGRYSTLQRYDPISRMWRVAGDDSEAERYTIFDGRSLRIANQTGCVSGVVVTTAGSGYSRESPPTVTAAEGGASLLAIVGGAISTAATIVDGGANYVLPPVLWIEKPPQPGVQACAYATISNGTISAVTFTDQGAGYLYPPTVAVLNDWRDTTGHNGRVAVSITGDGTVTAVVVTDHGSPIVSGTVPALTFSSGSAAGTAVLDWSVNAVTVATGGAGYTGAAGFAQGSAAGGYVSATPAYLSGPASNGMTRWRAASIALTTDASGTITAANIIDGGHYQGVPTPTIVAAAPPTTTGALTLAMGGANTTIYLQPAQLS